MNVRQFLFRSIENGFPAKIGVNARRQGGIILENFAGQTDYFVPFSEAKHVLAHEAALDQEALQACTDENPETIHILTREGETEQWYVWMDEGGIPHNLGNIAQVADLQNALESFIVWGNLHPEAISEDDPAWGSSFTMSEAVDEARRFGMSGKYLADRIRQAAEAGKIVMARQDTAGRWSFPKRQFRHWLRDSAAHKRGPKPKKTPNTI